MHVNLTIGILTYFREASLRRLLTSIERELPSLKQVSLKVVVVDTSGEASSKTVLEEFSSTALNCEGVYSPRRLSIPEGRNEVLAKTCDKWLLFLDDDQDIEAGSLQLFLAEAFSVAEEVHVFKWGIRTKTEAGDEADECRDIAPDHGSFFSGIYCGAGGAMIDMELVSRHTQEFDPYWAMDGGEDSAFFYQLEQLGARFYSLKNLKLLEMVSETRQTYAASCKIQRGRGVTWAKLQIRELGTSRWRVFLSGAGLLIYLILKWLVSLVLFHSKRRTLWLHIQYQWGVTLGVLGASVRLYD